MVADKDETMYPIGEFLYDDERMQAGGTPAQCDYFRYAYTTAREALKGDMTWHWNQGGSQRMKKLWRMARPHAHEQTMKPSGYPAGLSWTLVDQSWISPSWAPQEGAIGETAEMCKA